VAGGPSASTSTGREQVADVGAERDGHADDRRDGGISVPRFELVPVARGRTGIPRRPLDRQPPLVAKRGHVPRKRAQGGAKLRHHRAPLRSVSPASRSPVHSLMGGLDAAWPVTSM